MTRARYYAHSGNSADRENWHPLAMHLKDTGARASTFLRSTGCGDIGQAAGLLHDLGKYTGKFQGRLAGDVGQVDHSTAGAKAAVERYGTILGKMLAFCIAGHHAGLANGVNGRRTAALADRLERAIEKPDPAWEEEIELPQLSAPRLRPRDPETAGFCASFLIRMVFSALVDADFLDTEAYFGKLEKAERPRGQHPALGELLVRLDAHLATLAARADTGRVNDLRREVLEHARKKAAEPPGLFTLTVPTGGGKTLTSLAFALDHAVRHGLARVIYVIPYTSIIEQTASVFREALTVGAVDEVDFVVEHHSTFDEDQIGQREAKDKLRLAMENWDAPIIVTTAVQFFESLFANRPSRCRKLHNIVNSIVILDEAQTLPLRFLRPCVTALDELARNWRTSVVLCTATQPALAAPEFPDGLENVREIAPEPQRLYRTLKRTRVCRAGEMSDGELTERLHESPQVLCIVNTRSHARELYESIRDLAGAFHLTTRMCALHRREKLKSVRESLRNGSQVRLVATSLVEAGVDIDFPVVLRAEAGLESIIQAAGRCNREGKFPMGDVLVFQPADTESSKAMPEVAQLAAASREVMRQHDDPLSLEAIGDYFRKVYWIKGDGLDANRILARIAERFSSLDFPFEDIAARFRLIESGMVPVIVPYRGEEGAHDTVDRLLRELEWVERPGRLSRLLQPYVVQVPPSARAALLSAGAVRVVREADFSLQFFVLENLDLYREDVGLTWEDPAFREPGGLMF